MLAAGLKGIEEGLECHDAVEENVYEMPEDERESRGIKQPARQTCTRPW